MNIFVLDEDPRPHQVGEPRILPERRGGQVMAETRTRPEHPRDRRSPAPNASPFHRLLPFGPQRTRPTVRWTRPLLPVGGLTVKGQAN